MMAYGTQPALQVRGNGKGPFPFLLDTGASGKARIDKSVVEQLKLPKTGVEIATDEAAEAETPLEPVAVDTLELGGLRFRNISALSRGYNVAGEYLPDIGGILAFDLFSGQLLTIDFGKRRIRSCPGELPHADGQTVFNYEERNGVPYISVEIGQMKVSGLIDTGGDRSFDLPTSVVRKLPLAAYPHPVGKAVVLDKEVGIGEVELDVPVRIGRHIKRRPLVTFSESFDTPIIDASFLHSYALTFDQKNRRVRVERPNYSSERQPSRRPNP
jgi:predicted aspartyl protease